MADARSALYDEISERLSLAMARAAAQLEGERAERGLFRAVQLLSSALGEAAALLAGQHPQPLDGQAQALWCVGTTLQAVEHALDAVQVQTASARGPHPGDAVALTGEHARLLRKAVMNHMEEIETERHAPQRDGDADAG
jgi:hypothetical protein